jgi:hypothetical protein
VRAQPCVHDPGRSGGIERGDGGRGLDRELAQDRALGLGEGRGLLDRAGGPGERDELQPLELGAKPPPAAAGLALGNADEQEREPADHDVGADPLLQAVEDRADPQRPLQVAEGALGLEQVLVAEGGVLGRDLGVGGLERELAVEALLGLNPGAVDAKAAGGQLAQVARAGGVRTAPSFRCTAARI